MKKRLTNLVRKIPKNPKWYVKAKTYGELLMTLAIGFYGTYNVYNLTPSKEQQSYIDSIQLVKDDSYDFLLNHLNSLKPDNYFPQ
ncbi:MAG: hypothetical protein WC438_03305 [Candidatus Pacearchaeota archaeon]